MLADTDDSELFNSIHSELVDDLYKIAFWLSDNEMNLSKDKSKFFFLQIDIPYRKIFLSTQLKSVESKPFAI